MAGYILIIDDEPDMCTVASLRLGRLGRRVVTAGSAEEGLALIKKDPPALLLLDLRLPRMQGDKLCRLLKSDARFRRMPIILFTANAAYAASAENDCADDTIVKPFEPAELTDKVRKFLRKN